MIELAIVIINYKTPQLVIDCLKTLETEINTAQYKVIVIDNASGDDSPEILKSAIAQNQWETWVEVLASPVNGGFSAGNNLGIKAIEAEFYLLLNSDTLVHKGSIDLLLSKIKQNPQVGMVSPRLEWPDGTPQVSCFRYHNFFSEMIDSAGTSIITKLLSPFDVPLSVSETAFTPQWTSFACVLIRRQVIEQIGYLDEGYFMYYEDVDYCRRAQKKGWLILHIPQARVIHLRGGSSSVKTEIASRQRPPSYLYASRSRYFTKYYGRLGLLGANLCWLMGRSVSKLRETIGHKKPHTCEYQEQDIWRRSN